jgi:hypothetical protein
VWVAARRAEGRSFPLPLRTLEGSERKTRLSLPGGLGLGSSSVNPKRSFAMISLTADSTNPVECRRTPSGTDTALRNRCGGGWAYCLGGIVSDCCVFCAVVLKKVVNAFTTW